MTKLKNIFQIFLPSKHKRALRNLAVALMFVPILAIAKVVVLELKIPEKFTVLEEIKMGYPKLVQLIIGSESIDDNEKQYWFDILPSMTDKQIQRLDDILSNERRQLEELNLKYQEEIKLLNAKHLNAARSNPTLPTLRIDTQSHSGVINDVDSDAVGQFAVTVGRDKTARIWRLSDGKLHQTLRIPIAEGHEGMLYASALHPTEPWVVVTGVTTLGSEKGEMVAYVFHRDTGMLITTLKGLASEGSNLARMIFINNGQHLLVKAGSKLTIWRTQNWSKLHSFDDEIISVLPVSKKSSEFIVVENNYIIKYSLSTDLPVIIKKTSRSNFPKGNFGWTVSPDQKQALWGDEQAKVGLIDLETMTVLREAFKVDFDGVRGRPGMAWRKDGQIFLSYGHPSQENAPVLSVRLNETATVIKKLREASWFMQTLPNDDVLLTTGEPLIAVIPAKTNEWRILSNRVNTYQDAEGSHESILRASNDGQIFEFGFDFYRKNPHVFNLKKRSLTNGIDDSLNFSLRPDSPDVQIKLRNWNHWGSPSIFTNGDWKSLGNITSTSTAIAPDQKSFVIPTSWSIRRFDQSGDASWYSETEASATEVHVTKDARLVISTSGNGNIQWRDYRSGTVLLNFFPHVDGKRWVLWTPSGYYDASPGGEDLIGWHLNRGQDKAADFFAASQFRERFYRPDIIDKVLETLDEEEAILQANKAAGRTETAVSVDTILPPVVELISAPERFANNVLPVRIRIRAPNDAPSNRTRVLVNGEIMPSPKVAANVDADGSRDLILALPPKDSEVQIYADNRHGTSLPLIVNLKWAGDSKVFADGVQGSRKEEAKPKLWVLAVGVSSYKDSSVPKLDYAHRDADAFANILKAQINKGYREVNARVLMDDTATKASVLNGLDWLKTNVGVGDVGVVFLSGHGFTMATDRRYYYGASDVDLKRLTETGVPYKAIQDALVEFNLRGGGTRAVFFIDTCHAGDATGAQMLASSVKASNGEALAIELTRQENQVLVFASSKGDQVSWENHKFRHGAFTQALIEGLGDEWQADPYKLGHVTYKNLDAYISARIPVLTQKKQTPRLMAPPGGVDDFPFVSKQ